MHNITCPQCNTSFKVDKAGYADILKQVRDRDFEQQLNERLALAEQDKRNAIALAEAMKATEIQELQAQLKARDMHQELAVKEAVITAEKQRDRIAGELQQLRETTTPQPVLLKPDLPKSSRLSAFRKRMSFEICAPDWKQVQCVKSLRSLRQSAEWKRKEML